MDNHYYVTYRKVPLDIKNEYTLEEYTMMEVCLVKLNTEEVIRRKLAGIDLTCTARKSKLVESYKTHILYFHWDIAKWVKANVEQPYIIHGPLAHEF